MDYSNKSLTMNEMASICQASSIDELSSYYLDRLAITLKEDNGCHQVTGHYLGSYIASEINANRYDIFRIAAAILPTFINCTPRTCNKSEWSKLSERYLSEKEKTELSEAIAVPLVATRKSMAL